MNYGGRRTHLVAVDGHSTPLQRIRPRTTGAREATSPFHKKVRAEPAMWTKPECRGTASAEHARSGGRRPQIGVAHEISIGGGRRGSALATHDKRGNARTTVVATAGAPTRTRRVGGHPRGWTAHGLEAIVGVLEYVRDLLRLSEELVLLALRSRQEHRLDLSEGSLRARVPAGVFASEYDESVPRARIARRSEEESEDVESRS
ncbi:hypothetical protein EDB86DRAFT_839423 [Lactarius hatsudake]|nr:hypothetical protein EDB86DRAFT_839423 [Lactarius hatsudake]